MSNTMRNMMQDMETRIIQQDKFISLEVDMTSVKYKLSSIASLNSL